MKMKIEPRQPLHSRRMSKNSPNHNSEILQNGDDSNQNNFSAVKKTVLTNCVSANNEQGEYVNGHVTSGSLPVTEEASNAVVNDLKDALSKVGASLPNKDNENANTGQELANLKDLLILNLDLIQHQQQLLIARDRQIKSLTMEKDALKNRLERIDRRMSLLKQKNEPDVSPPAVSTGVTLSSTEDSHKTPSERANKRKSELKISSQTPRKQQRHSQKTPKHEEPPIDAPSSSEEPVHSLRSSDPPQPDQEFVAPKASPVRAPRRPQNTAVRDRYEMVRTPRQFYVPVVEYHDPEIVGKVVRGPHRKNKIKVEVPKWRFHPVSNCYQMEGTEITDDEVYLKRHLRFENDEKRRKRWDMQRLREQTAYQKLVASRASTSRAERLLEAPPVASLLPDTNDIRYIEVNDTLPVNVFGYALPVVPPSDFVLKKWPERPQVEVKETKTKQRRR